MTSLKTRNGHLLYTATDHLALTCEDDGPPPACCTEINAVSVDASGQGACCDSVGGSYVMEYTGDCNWFAEKLVVPTQPCPLGDDACIVHSDNATATIASSVSGSSVSVSSFPSGLLRVSVTMTILTQAYAKASGLCFLIHTYTPTWVFETEDCNPANLVLINSFVTGSYLDANDCQETIAISVS